MGLRRCGMAAGEELLDLGQDRVGLGEPGRMVRAVDLEVPRAGNVVGEVPAVLHRSGSSRAWMTRVGAEIVGRIARTSMRRFDSVVARNMPGLAHMRSTMASWRIDRTDGNITSLLRRCPTPSGRRGRFPARGRSASSTACSPHPARQGRAPAARPGRNPSRPSWRRAWPRMSRRGSAPAFAPVVLPQTRWPVGRPRSYRIRRALRSRRRP